MVDNLPNINMTRLCSGAGEGPCEFNAIVSTATSFLITGNSHLQLPRECLLCSMELQRNRKRRAKIGAVKQGKEEVYRREQPKSGEYSLHASTYVLNDMIVGANLVIHQSVMKKYVGAHEEVRRLLGLPVLQMRSHFAEPMISAERTEEMQTYLENTTILLPQAWADVHHMMERKDPDLFFFDTEFAGKLLCEIGIVNSEGKVVLDTAIEHGKTCDQLIRESAVNPIATSSILKYYGPNRQARPMMTLEALATKIEELEVGHNTTFVEWSTNNCDWHKLYGALQDVGKEWLMPPVEQSLKTIPFLKQGLFKKLETCSLPQLYPVIFPTCVLRHQSHDAAMDATKLYNVMRRVLNLKRNPTALWTQPAKADTDCHLNLSSTNSIVPVDPTGEGGVLF